MAKDDPPPGDPVSLPLNFKLSLDERLRGYMVGVPGYIRRRRRIEDLETRLLAALAAAKTLADVTSSKAFTTDLALLNDLIAKHNRYYPIEANLPVDIKSGRLLERGRPWRPLPFVTPADLAARFRELDLDRT